MEAVLREHPEFKLLGKTKFVQTLSQHGVPRDEARRYHEARELGQMYAPKKRKGELQITAPPFSFQIDVFELTRYKKSNAGVYRCFLAVDILSRKAFAYPLKDGRMSTVLGVYEQFMIDVGEPVNSVAGDAFFDNKAFRTFNETLMVAVYTDVAKDDHITAQGNKLGIVDRATRTLKRYIEKWMLEHDTTKWTSFLPKVLDLYNGTPHSTHPGDTSPDEVFADIDYMRALYKG
ncbi:hypothetical protein GPECTOR_43g939 [Gonium pectorale]|uniref:Integrase catalytic domain-containing protein n=1 Tax=Gonium pectorale TaxID=33097 RepID=A0A150G9I9_GONPE|nr:hypothetical protein GPECTOR_43g939 [Gonium pectorale]|eukprot:KXZ46502.1 hypothetical protein GPECTOR_43g939 [Gonium pectorale]